MAARSSLLLLLASIPSDFLHVHLAPVVLALASLMFLNVLFCHHYPEGTIRIVSYMATLHLEFSLLIYPPTY